MNSSWQVYSANNYWDPAYQSSLQVSTFPNPISAGFTGTSHTSFTSSCFVEGGSGNPEFASGWIEPELKKAPEEPVQESKEEIADRISVSPNPADKSIRLRGFGLEETVEISLYDLKGALVRKVTWSGSDSYQVSTESLSDGIYSLRIQHQSGVEVYKVLIYHQ